MQREGREQWVGRDNLIAKVDVTIYSLPFLLQGGRDELRDTGRLPE